MYIFVDVLCCYEYLRLKLKMLPSQKFPEPGQMQRIMQMDTAIRVHQLRRMCVVVWRNNFVG